MEEVGRLSLPKYLASKLEHRISEAGGRCLGACFQILGSIFIYWLEIIPFRLVQASSDTLWP
jgi:hypothetical protein